MDSSSKVAGDAGLGKVRRAGTDGRMAVTETRQTTETIAFIQVEISRLAFVAVLTFHMLLTLTPMFRNPRETLVLLHSINRYSSET